ncbi:MAG: hypothetical protein RJA70_2520 [Pseudomonadota bacterium]|jgi:hypothetical protein
MTELAFWTTVAYHAFLVARTAVYFALTSATPALPALVNCMRNDMRSLAWA